MKKFLLAMACIASTMVFADMTVVNNSPYPIKFSMDWKGKTAYNCSDIFNPKCWTEHADWSDPINPGQSHSQGGEMWNEKTHYKIQAKRDSVWEVVIDKNVGENGNRVITVTTRTDPDTGIVSFDEVSALK
jgi:hypothetical protein